MKKILPILWCLLCLLLLFAVSAGVSADSNTTVRVGVYENRPKVFTDDNGKVSGLWPDIMGYIASQEGWTIQYVQGTWTECMERLQNNQIDIMMDVAYTPERAQAYTLSGEIPYTSWSRVYVPKGSAIKSIPDLDGKTIAVMKGSINYEGPDGIKTLAESFKLNCTFLEVDDYVDVFELIDSKQADAGAVSKDFAYAHEADYHIEQTAIVFQPAYLHFAFCKDAPNAPYLKTTVDYQVGQLKADKNSIYYQSLKHWTGTQAIETNKTPTWLKWTLLGIILVALFLTGGVAVFRREVERKTRQLAQEVAEHKTDKHEISDLNLRYEALLSSIPDIVAEVDINKKYTWVNEAGYLFFGKDVIGKEASLYFEGEQNAYSKVDSIFQGDKNIIYLESWQRRSDGEKRLLGWWCRTLLNDDGSVRGALSTARDITDNKKTEQALIESKGKLEAVFGSMADAVFITDARGRFATFNDAFIKLNRYSSRADCPGEVDQFIEQRVFYLADGSIIPPDMRPAYRSLRGETVTNAEYRVRRKDTGEAWWGSYTSNPVRDKDGNIIGVVVVSHDITERKNTQDAISDAKSKLEAVFESMTDAVLITDVRGDSVDFNDAFAAYHRCSNKVECYAKVNHYQDYIALLYPDGSEVPPNMQPVTRALQGETANGVEYQLRRKDTGEAWWGSYSYNPIRDKENNIIGAVVVAHDITKRKEADEALKESENKFYRAFDSSPIGMAILDSETKAFVEVNERWAEILEYQPDEMIGRTTAELNMYPDPEVRDRLWKTLNETKRIQNNETGYRTKTGKIISVLLSAEIVMLKGREHLVSTILDITERRRIENALRENEKKLRDAQKMAHLGFWNWDIKTGDVEWSEEVFKIFQLDPDEFNPQIDSIQSLSPWPEDHQRDQELIKRAMHNHLPGSYEQKFLRPDNSIGYYYSTFQGKYDEKDELVSIVGTVLDITERKQAEESLQKANRLLLETGQIGKVGGWELDIDTGKQTWTEEVYHIHEVDTSFVPTLENGVDFYTPASRPVIESAVKRAIEQGEPYDIELEIITAKGNLRNVHAIGKADLENRRIYGFFQDITARKHADEEHRRMVEYQELDRIKTNLLSLISHELRTPLASIKGYASLLLMYDRKLKKEQKMESLEAIDRSTDRLAELIDHLLDMSRLDAGLLKLTLLPLNPKDIINSAVTEAKLRSPDFEFIRESTGRLPEITADSKRLRQILDNLLENAVKYSPPNTVITIKTEVKAKELQVSVTDQGRGIPVGEYEKIFERMYRIEQRMQKDPGGLGLGLSLCKALVEGHSGRIWVESTVGKGSTFYFTIPLKHEVKETKNAEKKKASV
jgi:PAS domain S-box-containing protein